LRQARLVRGTSRAILNADQFNVSRYHEPLAIHAIWNNHTAHADDP
jgi:hypothetical protein